MELGLHYAKNELSGQMMDIQIRFIPHAEISPELRVEVETLDQLAFADENDVDDPEFASIQWATPDWMALGFVQDRLVTQLCLPEREILVGREKLRVVGIGGMATHPEFQHKGLGSALLAKIETFMRSERHVPFGLLICANATRPFYERANWNFVNDALYYWQENERHVLQTAVMVLPLEDHIWPTGEIDLCGSPW